MPVLLTLLLAGALPPDGPQEETSTLLDSANSVITAGTLEHLRSIFRTPLTAKAIQQAALSPTPGPHLATEAASSALYLFDAAPVPTDAMEQPCLALPHTYTTPTSTTAGELPHPLDHSWSHQAPADGLLVFRT
ncbi:hypothetical protein OG883_40130 [Streptomyces sp. NBC_01142]|uniref:hypothetical protein n=1 Tax=Streptomyces sp. NBC_01142 TaxID=2975865 RepID=UPI0022582660|nr:hypothetical protein [Streptomyces sp. NBC_01142]MCX4825910.1 hypothetical protein [Streptomyces sp. NBC_01142]